VCVCVCEREREREREAESVEKWAIRGGMEEEGWGYVDEVSLTKISLRNCKTREPL